MTLFDKILDASIYYSFDLSGFMRHEKKFTNLNTLFSTSLKNKKVLITGGTSGIGLAAGEFLASMGTKTIVTGRNLEKGKVVSNIENFDFVQLDMVDWKKIPNFIDQIDCLDFLILNAGGMPEVFSLNEQNVEYQFASQLFGHYFLLSQLYKNKKLNKNAKVIWVTSGGMYLKSLDIKKVFKDTRYDKVATYANVKRAQVTILDELAKKFHDLKVVAMHPGWVDTPAVRECIPSFYQKMKKRLRSPIQGADTILWLLADETVVNSGELYFDRRKVLKHFFWFTKKSDHHANELMNLLNQYEKSFV